MPEAQAKAVDQKLKEGSPVKRALVFIKVLGPGLITGASDDDPASIGTFAQTGALFRYTQLWMLFFTLPLMIGIQEMCARIGLQTGTNLARLVRQHFPRPVLYFCVGLLFIANTINIGADLGVMAASAQLLLKLPFFVWLLIITGLSAGLEIFTDYPQYSKVLRIFALALLAFVVVAFVVPQDWGAALRGTFVPTLQLNQKFLMNFVALLGTAISPYLYFWQTSEEVEEKLDAGEVDHREDEGHLVEEGRTGVSHSELKLERLDVAMGMVLANFVGWTIIVTSASTLGKNGGTQLQSAVQFAQTLQPVAGPFAYFLFAAAIIGTGLLSVPVLAGSIAYALAGTLNMKEGLSQKLDQGPGFYAVIAIAMLVGAGIDLIGVNPMQALYYASIINGVVAAPLLVVVMLIANNKQVMQDRTNGPLSNIVGWITTIAMIGSAIALLANLIMGGSSS